MQAPAATVMTVAPDTAQSCVSARNETGSPELAVAMRVTAAPVPAPAGWANVIFCATFPAVTWKDPCTCRGGRVQVAAALGGDDGAHARRDGGGGCPRDRAHREAAGTEGDGQARGCCGDQRDARSARAAEGAVK